MSCSTYGRLKLQLQHWLVYISQTFADKIPETSPNERHRDVHFFLRRRERTCAHGSCSLTLEMCTFYSSPLVYFAQLNNLNWRQMCLEINSGNACTDPARISLTLVAPAPLLIPWLQFFYSALLKFFILSPCRLASLKAAQKSPLLRWNWKHQHWQIWSLNCRKASLLVVDVLKLFLEEIWKF